MLRWHLTAVFLALAALSETLLLMSVALLLFLALELEVGMSTLKFSFPRDQLFFITRVFR